MTLASVAGVVAGFLTRIALFGGGRSRDQNALVIVVSVIVVSAVVYAVSFLLTRMLSQRYRELAADRAGGPAHRPAERPGPQPLTRISGDMGAIPRPICARRRRLNAFFRPGGRPGNVTGLPPVATHPPLQVRLEHSGQGLSALGAVTTLH